MKRHQLEHLVRAASEIIGDEVLIVGSQAGLGQFPDAPPALLTSNEADLIPKNKPELADLIDGTIGELSPFHETFGYYAHGIDLQTAILPEGWRDRLVPVLSPDLPRAMGWCLEVHDLVVSKLIAARDKDIQFARQAACHRLIAYSVLHERLAATRLPEEVRSAVAGRITRLWPRTQS